jgi:hypothetical protein
MGEKVHEDVEAIWDDWQDAVNMSPAEIERWLDTDESRSVGQKSGGESVGHRSGRRIVVIKRKRSRSSTPTTPSTCTRSSATWPGTPSSARTGT